MATVADYRILAQEHWRLSTDAVTIELRDTYENVARAYDQLADQIERLNALGIFGISKKDGMTTHPVIADSEP
jgi:hypothetical protein